MNNALRDTATPCELSEVLAKAASISEVSCCSVHSCFQSVVWSALQECLDLLVGLDILSEQSFNECLTQALYAGNLTVLKILEADR